MEKRVEMLTTAKYLSYIPVILRCWPGDRNDTQAVKVVPQ